MPHIKTWWDSKIPWTSELIHQKYGTYVQGFKLEDNKQKAIHAFIICVDEKPIGYIQIYNAYDFKRDSPLIDLPESLAAFDFFIGEPDYLRQGIGNKALDKFFDFFDTRKKYDYVFADPDSKNIAAIKTYEKAGLKKIKRSPSIHEVWMLGSFKNLH